MMQTARMKTLTLRIHGNLIIFRISTNEEGERTHQSNTKNPTRMRILLQTTHGILILNYLNFWNNEEDQNTGNKTTKKLV